MSSTTSFQHTARVKYEVVFDSSNISSLSLKLVDLKTKIELQRYKDVHVWYQVTLEEVIHVENLLNQIIENYRVTFHVLPPNMKVFTVIQKLKEVNSPSAKDLAKEVLNEVLNPEKVGKPNKTELLKAAADKFSKELMIKIIKKNSGKTK